MASISASDGAVPAVPHAAAPADSIASARSSMPSYGPFRKFIDKLEGDWKGRGGDVKCDMAFGNPHDPPPEGLLRALRSGLPVADGGGGGPDPTPPPPPTDAFAYDPYHEGGRRAVSDALYERRGVRFDPRDVSLCNGALGGLLAVLNALTDPGDEVICVTPSYFAYGGMLDLCCCRRVLVPTAPDFDLDVGAIRGAVTARTRAVIVNSPNNPSGRVYPPETLRRLSDMLSSVGYELKRPVVVISDEAYSRIVYDGVPFRSVTEFYPHSLLVYTYGKSTLAPSERLGYIALSPLMPEGDRDALRAAIFNVQNVGYSFPNGTTARALPELERYSIDVSRLQRRRDVIVSSLRSGGWTVHRPEGTFYMLVGVPDGVGDDWELCDRLADRGVLAMPGSVSHLPGWVRLSLTASDDMVAHALVAFRDVMRSSTSQP